MQEKIQDALQLSQHHPRGYANLYWSGLKTEDIQQVADYIMSPNAITLKSLNLGFNELGETGGEMLINALISSKYCELKFLDLHGASIGDNTVKALAKYLISPTSSKLGTLYIGKNFKIRDLGKLCLALNYNTTLKNLSAAKCRLPESSVIPLTYLLTDYNATLKQVDVERNCIEYFLYERVEMIQDRNYIYDKLCEKIDTTLAQTPALHSNLSEALTDSQKNSIVKKLIRIFVPLPPWINDRSGDEITMLHSEVEITNAMYQFYTDFREPPSGNSALLRIFNVSNAVFKWKTLFIRSIIYSLSDNHYSFDTDSESS